MNLTLLSNLLTQPRADHPVVTFCKGVPISFAQFQKDVADTASRFAVYRRAALVCGDGYLFAVALFGLLHAGAQIILPPNGQAGTLQSLHNEFDFLVDDAAVAARGTEQATLAALNPHAPQLIFLTSGTTGTPKKITKTLDQLQREIAVLHGLWGQNTGTVFATVSHQHIYGLTFKILWPLMAARPFAAESYFVWETLLAALTPDAIIISSPAHLDRLDGIAPLARRPKQIFSAGAPLPLRACQSAKKIFGITPTEIFGSTETGAIATRRQSAGDEPWQTLPSVQIACDMQGALKILSPFAGDDWIETSDMIELMPGGFRFLGRADRIAKIEGKRIALDSVEQALEQSVLVKNAVALMFGDASACLAAAIVPSAEGRARLDAIGAFRFSRLLREHLAETQEAAGIPRQWRFVAALPQRALGKQSEEDIRGLFRGHA